MSDEPGYQPEQVVTTADEVLRLLWRKASRAGSRSRSRHRPAGCAGCRASRNPSAAAMAPPFQFDKKNIEEFSKIY